MKTKDKFINFCRPCIGKEEIREVVDCLKSGWLTTGVRTKQFESDFAEYTDAKFALALNSCTAALHLALEAVGLKEGDLVLVPTMTFTATAEVVRYFNAIPVFVDCNEDDFCINPDDAEEKILRIEKGAPVAGVPGKHGPLRGMIPVHFAGQPADAVRCRSLCEKHGLFLVEDCAHTCPAYYRDSGGKWKMAGRSADIACYSFYANKTITTGEGGMATTDNEKWADRMRIMSLHGMNNDAWKRFTKSGSWYYEIVAPGFKYNMTDIASSLGIHQLKKADYFWKKRTEIAGYYNSVFGNISGVTVPKEKSGTKHSWHLYILKIDPVAAGIRRNDFLEEMKKRNIGAGVHYIPLHLHPYYRESFGLKKGDFPVAEKLYEQCVSIPIYPGLKERELKRITEAVREIIEKGQN